MKFPINTSTYSGFLWDFQGTFFLLNNDQRIYPPVSPAAYHEISWCIVLRQSCRASDWWRMWVKTKPHTHTPPMTGGWFIVWPTWYHLRSGSNLDTNRLVWMKRLEQSWLIPFTRASPRISQRWFPNTMIPSTRATSHGILWTRKKQTVQVHTWHDWLIDDDYWWLMMITDD